MAYLIFISYGKIPHQASLKIIDQSNFIHMHRILNTTVKGTHKAAYALRGIKGIGPRFAHIVLRKAQIDCNKRAGELTEKDIEKITDVVSNPATYHLPAWVLNRQKDPKDGTSLQLVANNWDTKIREDIERMRKTKQHKGLRHFWGLKVRGQHTCSTGRTGSTMGYIREKK